MKKIIFFLVTLPFSLSSQNPVVEWSKTFGGSKIEYSESIIVTKDNKYLVAGHTSSTDGDITNSHGSADGWLIKLDENGNLLWQKTYGGSGGEGFRQIIQTLDDGFIMVGSTNSNNGDVIGYKGGDSDIWVVKIDSIGTIQWQKTIGDSTTEFASSIFQTKNGDYIIGANSKLSAHDLPQNAGDYDWWVLKLDNKGNLVWKKRMGGSKTDLLSEIVNIDDKTFAIAGSTYSDDGDFIGTKGDFTVKMDSSGNILWKKSYGSPFDTLRKSIESHAITMSKNDIVSAGMMIQTQSPDNPSGFYYSWEFWVTKCDTAGNRKWSKLYGGSDSDNATSVKAFPNGDLLVTGYTQSPNDRDVKNKSGHLDFWVVRLDSLGNLKNADCYGGMKEDQSYTSVIDKKGNIIVAGFSYSTDGTFTQNKGQSDWAIVKLRYSGTSTKEQLMDETAIVEYPNPVQDQLVVRIAQNISPNLIISDVLGKPIYRKNHLEPETLIDMSAFPNGVYILTYQLEGEAFSRKIIKML